MAAIPLPFGAPVAAARHLFAVGDRRGARQDCKLIELLMRNTRVDAQQFDARLGFMPSHVGMTLRF